MACVGDAAPVPDAGRVSTVLPNPKAAPILREWTYRLPQPQTAPRSASLPSRPGPVERSRTPVAFAVKEDAELGGSRHPWHAAAASVAASAAASATMMVAGSPQQQQPVVATLVTSLACNLQSRLEHVYAGVAERIEDGISPSAPTAAATADGGEKDAVRVVDPSTREVICLPPPPSALPDEHGLASASLASLPPSSSGLDDRRCKSEGTGCLSSALSPPSASSLEQEPAPQRSPPPRERNDTEESLDGWVLDAYDEAEFRVVDGRLVEVRVPLPSVEDDELYEEALERHMGRGRGIGCIRRPRGGFPGRQKSFAEIGRQGEVEGHEVAEISERNPLGSSASERNVRQGNEDDDNQCTAVGKNTGSKVRNPVRKWMQRRREARQQRREKKNSGASQKQETLRVDPRCDAKDEDYDASSSERSARAAMHHNDGARNKAPRRSRSVPVPRRRTRSKHNKEPAQPRKESGRTKSRSRKNPKNFKKAKRRRKRSGRKRRAYSDNEIARNDASEREESNEEDYEEDSCLRLKPLPTDPRPKPHAEQAVAASAVAFLPPPAAPIAQVIRRTCSSVAVSSSVTKLHQPPQSPFLRSRPALAYAATATARAVGGLFVLQQKREPPAKCVSPENPTPAPDLPEPVAKAMHVPPPSAFLKLPPLHPPAPATGGDNVVREFESSCDEDENEQLGNEVALEAAESTTQLPPSLHERGYEPKMAPRRNPMELERSSNVDSLLEEITRALDEALDAYPRTEHSRRKVAPSLAVTEVGSVDFQPEKEDPWREPRPHLDTLESLHDTGVLMAPPGPSTFIDRSGAARPAAPLLTFRDMEEQAVNNVPQHSPVEPAGGVCSGAISAEVQSEKIARCSPPPPTLKVVFVGDSISSIPGAADVARRLALRQRKSRRSSLENDDKAPAFEVWNSPGARRNNQCFNHHASQSVFYAPDALYVLFWDMALGLPETYPRAKRITDDADHSDDEYDDHDHYAAEEYRRCADRALERCIEEDVSAWAERVLRALEDRQHLGGGGRCAFLPVALVPSGTWDSDEIHRRLKVLRSRLLRQCEEWARRKRNVAASGLFPEFIFPGEGGGVIHTSPTDGAEVLSTAIASVADGRAIGRSPLSDLSWVDSRSDTAITFSTVRNVVRELKKTHKVVSVNQITVLSAMAENVKAENIENKTSIQGFVAECLISMSEICEILYFGGRAASRTHGVVENEAKGCDDENDDILDHFVVLDHMWLASAMSCILRPDIKRELIETRSLMGSQLAFGSVVEHQREASSEDVGVLLQSSCAVVASQDVRMLWTSMEFMREASDQIEKEKLTMPSPPSEVILRFLEAVLVKHGVFLPLLRTGESARNSSASRDRSVAAEFVRQDRSCDPIQNTESQRGSTKLFMIPGLLAPNPPSDVWTYKAKESWSTTLCHSWLTRETVPAGLMERVTVSVLQDLMELAGCGPKRHLGETEKAARPIRVHQVMVWRTAFLLRLGMDVVCPLTGEQTESVIELFAHLCGANCSFSGPPCVASDSLGCTMKRLVVSAKGQAGDAGRKIWEGGFGVVMQSVHRALQKTQEGTASAVKEVVCPDCLSLHHPSEASTWKADTVQAFREKGHRYMRCEHGHHVEVALLCGAPQASLSCHLVPNDIKLVPAPVMPVTRLLDGVVVVGLWDCKAKQIRNVGSGFVADKERGLIVTASHILFDMQSTKGFGRAFYGLKEAKAVVGVIPKPSNSKGSLNATAVFRYFAELVVHDVRNVDACILRITTRFEGDVGGDGDGCGDQPEIPLKNNMRAMKAERLHHLKLTKKCELEEDVRILGYNQGGEGRLKPGTHVNRCADFARGYVCKKFKIAADEQRDTGLSCGFSPLEETVVICPTISGHSGGPCVNQAGSVIGILSRADPADRQRCYLVPSSELKKLLKKAKAKCTMSPLDLYYDMRST